MNHSSPTVTNPQTAFDYLCSSLIVDICGDKMGLKSSGTLHLHGPERGGLLINFAKT